MSPISVRTAAALLGVAIDASPDEITAAFRTRVREVHPDTSVGAACEDLGRLAEAKDLLVRVAQERTASAADATGATATPSPDDDDTARREARRAHYREWEERVAAAQRREAAAAAAEREQRRQRKARLIDDAVRLLDEAQRRQVIRPPSPGPSSRPAGVHRTRPRPRRRPHTAPPLTRQQRRYRDALETKAEVEADEARRMQAILARRRPAR